MEQIERVVEYQKKAIHIPEAIIEKESVNPILQNLFVTWAGLFTKAGGHLVRRSSFEEDMVTYCVGGKGWYEVNGKRYDISKGNLFFCFKDTPHAYGADPEYPWTIYWLHFRGNLISYFFHTLNASPDTPVLDIGENLKLISLLDEAVDTLLNGYSLNYLTYSSLCLQQALGFLSRLLLKTASESSPAFNPEDVISHMLAHMEGHLTLEQMASHSNLSVFGFAKKFKSMTGYPPMDYYIRLKIQKACQLLNTGSISIKEISCMLGFSSPYYFSNTFKRVVGCSPSNYRKNHYT
jgi:AraC-like DNA-binding protein